MSQMAFDHPDEPPAVVAFRRFHEDNPHVYAELVKLARRGKRAGRKKLGINQLVEVLRWQISLSTTDPDFKINNNYAPHYARLIMRQEPDLDGIFELRRSYADEVRL